MNPAADRLSALELVLLDAAAAAPAHFADVLDDPQAGMPAGLLDDHTKEEVAGAIHGLIERGWVALYHPSTEPPVFQASPDVIASRLRNGCGPGLEGWFLTRDGGAVWERFRNPWWYCVAHWVRTADGVACVAGSERRAVELAETVARIAGCSSIAARDAVLMPDWRETYWRPAKPGYRVDVAAEGQPVTTALFAVNDPVLRVQRLACLWSLKWDVPWRARPEWGF